MRISTRTRYGARALSELARAWPDGVLSVKALARRQRLSVKYLERIMSALKRAGVVQAVRGTRGGYRLVAPPESVRMSDVFLALDGGWGLVKCVDRPESCSMSSRCPTRRTWQELRDALTKVLDRTTLRDLAERCDGGSRPASAVYDI